MENLLFLGVPILNHIRVIKRRGSGGGKGENLSFNGRRHFGRLRHPGKRT